jgi:hypothetical protein
MIQIIEVDTGEGMKPHAWIQHAMTLEDARQKFENTYDYAPKDAFKMFPGVVCGPLDMDADYGGHA